MKIKIKELMKETKDFIKDKEAMLWLGMFLITAIALILIELCGHWIVN